MQHLDRRHYFADFFKSTINPPINGDAYEKESKIFDYVVFFIISINVLCLMLETELSLSSKFLHLFAQADNFFTVIFIVEYILRLYACNALPKYSAPFWGRIKYMFSFFAIIDLLCILPALVLPGASNLGSLRLLRIFRLFKFIRLSSSANIIVRVVVKKRDELLSIFLSVILLIVFSASFIYYFEHEAQPKEFSSIISSIWWAVITLTTIGYGDVYPITTAGKLLAGFIALLGIGLVSLPSGIIASGFHEEYQSKKEGRLTNMEYKNHLLICYWDNKLYNSIKRILRENPSMQVVLLANLVAEDSHKIKDLLADQKNFFFIRGKPSDVDSLNKAGIHDTKNVLITTSNTNAATDILFTAGIIETIDQNIHTTLLVEDIEAARAFQAMQSKFTIDQILCIEDLIFPHLANLLASKDTNSTHSQSIQGLLKQNIIIEPVFKLLPDKETVTFEELVLACLEKKSSFLCLRMEEGEDYIYSLNKEKVIPKNAEVYLTQGQHAQN